MLIRAETLDDILLQLYPVLLATDINVTASRGDNSELIGVLIEIENPRARLSRSETRGRLFSSLGELLWYLTRGNSLEFIEPYIHRYRNETEDNVTVYGGYGPRLFAQRGNDQVRNVIELLQGRPTSRRAMIQIFNAEDIATDHNEIPCTATLQFLLRENRLHLVITMRSNDAYLGLPHDVFCFTMLQELVARSLGCELGGYSHFVGSMHLYKDNRSDAEALVSEGFQARKEMPPMPIGDPWPAVNVLLDAEHRARENEIFDANDLDVDPYWADLIRLVQVFFSSDDDRIRAIAESMSFKAYRPYITARIANRGASI
jgi:thymidylate synthase